MQKIWGLISVESRLSPHKMQRLGGYSPQKSSSNIYPSDFRLALLPVHSCHLRTITSQYVGSSSIIRAVRPVFSAAISDVPEPPNRSRIIFSVLLEFSIARFTSSTEFMAGCKSFLIGLAICHRSFGTPPYRRVLSQIHRILIHEAVTTFLTQGASVKIKHKNLPTEHTEILKHL